MTRRGCVGSRASASQHEPSVQGSRGGSQNVRRRNLHATKGHGSWLAVKAAVAYLAVMGEASTWKQDERQCELEAMGGSHSDFMYVLDRDHRFTYANPAAGEFFGMKPEDMIGKTFAEIGLPAEKVEARCRELDDVLRGKIVKAETLCRSPTGRVGYFEHVFVPVLAADGSVRAIAGHTRDISERKRIEEERLNNLARLDVLAEASKAFTAATLDLGPLLQTIARIIAERIGDGCCVRVSLADNGIIDARASHHRDPVRADVIRTLMASAPTHMSDGLQGLLRTTTEPLFMPQIAPDEARGLIDPHYLSYLDCFRPHSVIAVRLTIRGRMVGSLCVFRDLRAKPHTRADLALIEDLAERATLAIENARLFREAQHAVRAREELLAVVSHDLKNPLGAIRLGAELMSVAGRRSEVLDMIYLSATRMETLIADLLDTASVQAGRFAVETKPEHAELLVVDALDAHDTAAKAKGIVLGSAVDIGDIQLAVDRGRMQQVFSNLIGNALKFSRSGDTIRIEAIVDELAVRFAVADTGPGIPDDDLEHIFEPYWSGTPHAKQGTGLGLYISKSIVEAHGGRLWVESILGAGTTFYFTVPIVEQVTYIEAAVAG